MADVNPFDQFIAAPTPKGGANPFDQFVGKAQEQAQPDPAAEQPGLPATVRGMFNQIDAPLQGVKGSEGLVNLGPLQQFDFGPGYTDWAGTPRAANPAEHVTLMDPESGKTHVYAAPEETRLNPVRAVGGYLLNSMLTGPVQAPQRGLKAATALQQADRAGIQPTAPMVFDSPMLNSAVKTVQNLPVAGWFVNNAVKRANNQFRSAVEARSSELGTPQTTQAMGTAIPDEIRATLDRTAPAPDLGAAQASAGSPLTSEAAGSGIQRAATEFVDRTTPQSDVAGLADQVGAAGTPDIAGGNVRRSLQDFVGSKSDPEPGSFLGRSNAAYDNVWKQFPKDTVIPIPRTVAAMQTPMTRFEGAPEIGQAVTSPQLRSFAGALAPRTEQVPAKLWSVLGEDGNPLIKEAATTVQKGGSLTVGQARELRSFLGRALNDPQLVPDIPRSDLSRAYGGLSEDIKGAAQNLDVASAGATDASRSLRIADFQYAQGQKFINDVVRPVIGEGSPEQLFNRMLGMAQSKGGADIMKLGQIKSALPPAQWQEFAASTVQRMARNAQGAADPVNFVHSFSTLSGNGKNMLFGIPGTPARDMLETAVQAIGQRAVTEGHVAGLPGITAKSGEAAINRIMTAAQDSSGADIEGLRKLRSIMPDEVWKDLSATTVSRLGRAADGTVAPERWAADYAKLSPQGRDSLFGAPGSPVRMTLDAVADANAARQRGREMFNRVPGMSGQAGEVAYERLVAMAKQGRGGDIETLNLVKSNVPADVWGDFSSTIASKLGAVPKSVPAAVSPTRFVADYGALSEAGRDVLFGQAGNETRNALDALQQTGGKLKALEAMGNPSGSGRMGVQFATAHSLITNTIKTAAELAGASVPAALLMSPKFTRELVGVLNASPYYLPAATAQLSKSIDAIRTRNSP